MADHAYDEQLPSMVRQPKAVWPGLVRMGMYQKQIAGDGNCLFASLSDQLFGTPERHPEIRAQVIEHMRNLRPLFEHYVHKDDVQQRRTLRSAAAPTRRQSDDAFEQYLTLMSQSGTYGGEPELVAFCQVFDQDVTVHLPHIKNFNRDSISYTNEHRDKAASPSPASPLHICYGGDEITRAHYDSARSRDGSIPRSQNSPVVKPIDASGTATIGLPSPNPAPLLSTRAIRNSRSDLSSELLHDIIEKGKKDIDDNRNLLGDKFRAKSPSATSSSQQSSSSKRSLDDDGEQVRSTKRVNRQKSLHSSRRADLVLAVRKAHANPSPRLAPSSPTTATTAPIFHPSSSPSVRSKVIRIPDLLNDDLETSDSTNDLDQSPHKLLLRPTKNAIGSRSATIKPTNTVANRPTATPANNSKLMSVTERPKPILRA